MWPNLTFVVLDSMKWSLDILKTKIKTFIFLIICIRELTIRDPCHCFLNHIKHNLSCSWPHSLYQIYKVERILYVAEDFFLLKKSWFILVQFSPFFYFNPFLSNLVNLGPIPSIRSLWVHFGLSNPL